MDKAVQYVVYRFDKKEKINLYQPVIQTSQIGYHPTQDKEAVIEMDIRDNRKETAQDVYKRQA